MMSDGIIFILTSWLVEAFDERFNTLILCIIVYVSCALVCAVKRLYIFFSIKTLYTK